MVLLCMRQFVEGNCERCSRQTACACGPELILSSGRVAILLVDVRAVQWLTAQQPEGAEEGATPGAGPPLAGATGSPYPAAMPFGARCLAMRTWYMESDCADTAAGVGFGPWGFPSHV